jgi:hypothetical protein
MPELGVIFAVAGLAGVGNSGHVGEVPAYSGQDPAARR